MSIVVNYLGAQNCMMFSKVLLFQRFFTFLGCVILPLHHDSVIHAKCKMSLSEIGHSNISDAELNLGLFYVIANSVVVIARQITLLDH